MADPEPDLTALDADDIALLAALATGTTGEELATQLRINPRTVQRRISRVRLLLGARSTIQAVVVAVKRDLI